MCIRPVVFTSNVFPLSTIFFFWLHKDIYLFIYLYTHTFSLPTDIELKQ